MVPARKASSRSRLAESSATTRTVGAGDGSDRVDRVASSSDRMTEDGSVDSIGAITVEGEADCNERDE